MIGVLVIDDNEIFRRAVAEMLRGFDFLDVYEASSGEEALEKFKTYLPDLMFLDLALGRENGFHLIPKIRALEYQVDIALLTSFDLREYREAALDYNVDHYLVKGISTADDIQEVVNMTLAKCGGNQSNLLV